MTYKQLATEITSLLESHAMIHTTKFATPIEWLNWDDQPVFPLASFSINSGSFNLGKQRQYDIQFWFIDKSGVEGEFETEVVNDMHQIAGDIISSLRNGANEFVIDDNIRFDVISEKFEDYLSGVQLTLSLTSTSAFDKCDMPTI
ncbi:MAG: hypothetical protein ACOVOQ_13270 [Flavobacterium sp.]|jgi:hypothetical protein